MNQIDVIKGFVEDTVKEAGVGLLVNVDDELESQDIVIAFRRAGYVFMTEEKYSAGVTRAQNLVRRLAPKLIESPQGRFEVLKDNRDKVSEVIQAFNKLEGATRLYIR